MKLKIISDKEKKKVEDAYNQITSMKDIVVRFAQTHTTGTPATLVYSIYIYYEKKDETK